MEGRSRARCGSKPGMTSTSTLICCARWRPTGSSADPSGPFCAGWADAPRDSHVELRLLAGLFRIVLTGRAPELERFYPCLEGLSDPSDAWTEVRRVLVANIDELAQALSIAPQTNDVGRSNALLTGIFAAVTATGLSKVRLLEPGASAGLNLLVDRFRFVNPGWAYGPPGSPVQLEGGIRGVVHPVDFDISERRGCDVSPVDAASEDGQLRLRSFVWPFHVERHERLSAALRVAHEASPIVDQATAGEWLTQQLAQHVPTEVLTVVWHSISRLYWAAEETSAVQEAVAQAATRLPIAHVCMEYPRAGGRWPAELTLAWSGGSCGDRLRYDVMGTVGDHGFPVTLEA